MKRLNDTGWVMNKLTSRPQRGIVDFERTIEYDRILTESELYEERESLSKDNCPGYWGVTGRNLKNNTYIFFTTQDSSD